MKPETRQSVILVGGTGIATALGLVFSAVAGRLLGPERGADFFAAVSLVAFCQIALGPINTTVARFCARFAGESAPGKVHSLYRAVSRRVIVVGAIAIAAALLATPLIRIVLKFDSAGPVIAALLTLYVTFILSVARGTLRGLQAFVSLNVNNITEALVRLTLGILLLLMSRSATVAVAAYLSGTLIAALLGHMQVRAMVTGHQRERVDGKEVVAFTLPVFVMMLIAAGFQNVDMLLVKSLFSDAAAGLFGAAHTLSRTMGALVTPFNTLMLPMVARMHGEGENVAGPMLRVVGYFLLLAAVPLAVFALAPDLVMTTLFGADFKPAGALLFPLSLARLAGHTAHMGALACAGLGRFRFLYVYGAGFFAQVILLTLFHGSPEAVVRVALVSQIGTMIAVGVYLLSLAAGSAVARRGGS